jgi:hypothetical protein
MSDTLRCYRAVQTSLFQLFTQSPKGRLAQSLDTLTWMIVGIVRSGQCQLPAIASQMLGEERESDIKRLSRFVQNEHLEGRFSYLSFSKPLLKGLAKRLGRIVLVIDGSEVGKGCRALVVSVLYRGRALPLAYLVEEGSKGHFSEAQHLTLLRIVKGIVPSGVSVTFIGDGEFDGTDLLAQIHEWDWEFVCRTAKNALLSSEGETFSFSAITPSIGETASVWDVRFTKAAFGPVLAVAAWRDDCKEPIYLISNLELPQEALYWYQLRFRIETFFSDQKSRGFHLQKSHLSDPSRLARLMIAACLSYLWIVFLGRTAQKDGWMGAIHRRNWKKRCDLSLFRLGQALLHHLLNRSLPIPVDFFAPPSFPCESVRY